MGTGRSKKEAKHSAAKALLDKLTGAAPADTPANGNVPEAWVLNNFNIRQVCTILELVQ